MSAKKKRHDTLRYFGFELPQDPPIHQIQPCLNFICSLNSHHAFLVASLETIRVVEECWGGGGRGQGKNGLSLEELHCINIAWPSVLMLRVTMFKRWWRTVWIVPPLLGEAENFLNDPRINPPIFVIYIYIYLYIKTHNTPDRRHGQVLSKNWW